MSIGPKLRFEVFKRDGFTCQYCGRKTPIVVLEVDHVVPRAEGGTDDIENLVTSCWDCNRGKGKGLLDDRAPVSDLHDQAVMMLEKERQLKEYNEVKRQVREREDCDISDLHDYWEELCGRTPRLYPYASSLRTFLRVIPKEDIKDAMHIAYDRQGDYRGVQYLYGILHKWRKERTGEGADE